ncbi:MAG: D-glycerate dehydrogenase [Verrucomicrobia subdivision 3 bacterium]|nr:D-glycerate dehydrogenase [Limisphaerales bacterium]
MKRVLITNEVPSDVFAPLAGTAEVIFGPSNGNLMPRNEVLQLGPTLDGIINQGELRADAELLDHCPRLHIVANIAAGTENLDGALMAQRGVWATNTPGVYCQATADLTLAFLLCLARRVLRADAFVRSGKWDQFQPGVWDGDLLEGRTLGIIGYGRIGKAVAHRARAFGMNIVHHGRSPSDEPGYRSLDTLLQEADYVSLHVPLTPETRGLMNRMRFGQMKRGAYFLNMARGKTTVEADLVTALECGHLAGAALDVFEDEPKVHPKLLAMPNVVLAPHIGGGTHQSRQAARCLAVENVARVLRGEAPITPINLPMLAASTPPTNPASRALREKIYPPT